MIAKYSAPFLIVLMMCSVAQGFAAESPDTNSPPPALPSTKAYVIAPNDLVLVKVYRQDDLESRLRISANGTTSFPLLGTINLGGRTVEEATGYLRDLLAKDYLVNPQVTITVLEYAKRRFTVLGQVQKPGTFEIPSEESVGFLEAIAMAGGFTRLANTGKIVVTRMVNGKKSTFTLDARAITADGNTAEVTIMPEDTITVPQRLL